MTNYNKTHPVREDEATAVLKKFAFDVRYEKEWRYKYQNLRSSAVKRNVNMCLSFRQYIKLAKKAGLKEPSQIGRTSVDNYQMGRIGDTGDYEWGNCRFITMEQNKNEKIANGGQERASQKIRGRNKFNNEGYARVSASKIGRTKENDVGRRITSEKLKGRKRPASDFESRTKRFVVVSPSGKKYTGKDLTAFCRKHDLIQSCMSRAVRGKQASHRGWTGKYLEIDRAN
jgi:hypothetical protein